MAIGTTAAILGAAAIGGGTSLIAGSQQAKAAKQGAQAVQNATDQSAATQRYIFDQIRNDTATQRQAGDAATRQLAAIMGLNLGPQAQGGASQPQILPQPAGGGWQTPNGSRFDGGELPGIGGGMILPQMQLAPDGTTANALSTASIGTGQFGAPTQVPMNAMSPATQPGAQQPLDVTAWLRSMPGYEANFKEGQRALSASQAARGGLLSGDAGREAIRYGQDYGDRIFNQERNALFNLAGMGQVSQGQSNQAGQSYANNLSNLNMNNANALASSYQNKANAWTNALGGVAGAGMWALGKF